MGRARAVGEARAFAERVDGVDVPFSGRRTARDRIGVSCLGEDVVRGDPTAGGRRHAVDVARHLGAGAGGLNGCTRGEPAGEVECIKDNASPLPLLCPCTVTRM